MSSDIYNLRFIVNCEMACLSAFRNSYCNATEHTLDDRPSPESGLYRYTEDDNRRRNRDLRDELLRLGYDVTEIEGTSYTENEGTADATEVRETTLVVININDDDDFYGNIFRLSELYNQDCFLYKEKDFVLPNGKVSSIICKKMLPVSDPRGLSAVHPRFRSHFSALGINRARSPVHSGLCFCHSRAVSMSPSVAPWSRAPTYSKYACLMSPVFLGYAFQKSSKPSPSSGLDSDWIRIGLGLDWIGLGRFLPPLAATCGKSPLIGASS